MENFVALCLATGLSAACGLRIFIPPLVLSIAAHNGIVPLSSDGNGWGQRTLLLL